MRTILCERLGIDLPIIQAAMHQAACPSLVGAVSNAGGLGMLQCGWLEPEAIIGQIQEARASTDRPFGVGFVLDRPQDDRIEVALRAGVRIISLFWGDPATGAADSGRRERKTVRSSRLSDARFLSPNLQGRGTR